MCGDSLVAEDLAVTTLINSRFGIAAFRSLALHGGEVDLRELPDVPLERTTDEERDQVARLIATVAGWTGFAASVATKVLHKKRPRLIPILDNQAIFGAYMNPRWPQAPSLAESVKALPRIREAQRAGRAGRPPLPLSLAINVVRRQRRRRSLTTRRRRSRRRG